MKFELSQFRAPENFKQTYGTLPSVRSPTDSEDVHVHVDWACDSVVMLRYKGTFFLVDQAAYEDLAGKMIETKLFVAASSEGGVFIWPVKLDSQSAVDAADKAKGKWQHVAWNKKTRAYEVTAPAKEHAEPSWPYKSFEALLSVAFKKRVITGPEHRVVKEILGKETPQSA